MDCIRLLPEIVANQIAAGEVVNNPSNVVKEMMENSLDAGARTVRVNFRNGGKDLIQIVDDGVGMSAMDARMAFDRHATSKIGSIEDVYKLHTFGFRGEALASIAAVAEVELRTRREEDELGTMTTIAGGEFRSQVPVQCSRGSQFMVRNLFYNVPSRRKFIDGDNSRLSAQIRQEFHRVALCNPDVEMELRQNDQVVYTLRPTNRAGRIVDLIGKHIKQNLLDVEVDTSVVRIEGFVGRPRAAKKRNNEQYLFVNGRYFNSVAMQRAIVRAYERLIPEGCMPSYFIYLTVEPDRVDVNVHPQKTTVKFADHDLVLEILQAAVRETLAKTGAVPMMDFTTEGANIPVLGSNAAVYREPLTATKAGYNPFAEEYVDPTAPMPDVPFTGFDVPYDGSIAKEPQVAPRTPYVRAATEYYDVLSSSAMTPPEEFAIGAQSVVEYIDTDTDAVSQEFDFVPSAMGSSDSFGEAMAIGSSMAVALYGGRLVVVHLRRARERILYETIMASLRSGCVATERLIFPEELELSNEEYCLMEEHATEFAALGFDVEYCSMGRIRLMGHPAVVSGNSAFDELIYRMLHDIDLGAISVEEQRRAMAELMARRESQGYGRGVGSGDVVQLLRQLEECADRSFTPSGAPIMAELSVEELKSRLARN